MVAVDLAGKKRTSLVRIAADRDHGFHLLIQEIAHVLRIVIRNVDPDFGHDFDRQWVDITSGLGAGVLDVEKIACRLEQNAFGQVTAARVACANREAVFPSRCPRPCKAAPKPKDSVRTTRAVWVRWFRSLRCFPRVDQVWAGFRACTSRLTI
jgi:hypothetical protein